MPQAVGIAVAQFLFAAGAPLGIVNFFAIGAGGTLLLTGATLAANVRLVRI